MKGQPEREECETRKREWKRGKRCLILEMGRYDGAVKVNGLGNLLN